MQPLWCFQLVQKAVGTRWHKYIQVQSGDAHALCGENIHDVGKLRGKERPAETQSHRMANIDRNDHVRWAKKVGHQGHRVNRVQRMEGVEILLPLPPSPECLLLPWLVQPIGCGLAPHQGSQGELEEKRATFVWTRELELDPSTRLTTLLQLWKLLCNQGVAVCLPSRRLGRLGWRRFQCEGIMKIRWGAKGCLESQPHLFFVHDAFASEVYQINRQVPMLCSRRNHWISSVLIQSGTRALAVSVWHSVGKFSLNPKKPWRSSTEYVLKAEGGHPARPPAKVLEVGSFSATTAKECPRVGSQAAFLGSKGWIEAGLFLEQKVQKNSKVMQSAHWIWPQPSAEHPIHQDKYPVKGRHCHESLATHATAAIIPTRAFQEAFLDRVSWRIDTLHTV